MSNTIGQICSRFSSGDTITTKSIQTKGKYPVYGGNGLRGYTDSYNFDGECAIIGRQGAKCGNVRYFKGKAFMTEHAIIAVANKDNSSGYLSYKLQQMNLNRYQGQSAQPGLSVKTLSDVPISMPPLKVQENIFDILNTISIKIENNNKIISELECMAKTIYDYWFLQFEFPNEDGKPYKSSGGKMVWNEELKREIPEGWGVTNVGNITTCLDSKRVPLSSKDRESMKGPYPYYGATSEMDSVNEYLFDGDYVLLAEDGSVMDDNGFPILQRTSGKVWVNNHAHVLQPKEPYGCKLLMFILKNIPVSMIKTGSIQMKVNQENLNAFKVLSIPENIIEKANSILNPIDTKIIMLKQENQKLASLRDFLLPMLMNGQVTFKEEA